MTKRSFLSGLGAFFILPSAGRIWKAIAPEPQFAMAPCCDQWGGRRFLAVRPSDYVIEVGRRGRYSYHVLYHQDIESTLVRDGPITSGPSKGNMACLRVRSLGNISLSDAFKFSMADV